MGRRMSPKKSKKFKLKKPRISETTISTSVAEEFDPAPVSEDIKLHDWAKMKLHVEDPVKQQASLFDTPYPNEIVGQTQHIEKPWRNWVFEGGVVQNSHDEIQLETEPDDSPDESAIEPPDDSPDEPFIAPPVIDIDTTLHHDGTSYVSFNESLILEEGSSDFSIEGGYASGNNVVLKSIPISNYPSSAVDISTIPAELCQDGDFAINQAQVDYIMEYIQKFDNPNVWEILVSIAFPFYALQQVQVPTVYSLTAKEALAVITLIHSIPDELEKALTNPRNGKNSRKGCKDLWDEPW